MFAFYSSFILHAIGNISYVLYSEVCWTKENHLKLTRKEQKNNYNGEKEAIEIDAKYSIEEGSEKQLTSK